jgi:hypothetical protein
MSIEIIMIDLEIQVFEVFVPHATPSLRVFC